MVSGGGSVSQLNAITIMAHSYTPGLTVTEQAVVRRRRMLSLPGSVLVTIGETVRANQAVARAELPGKVYPLNLANQLSVAPDEIHEYLIKKVGDSVQKDEILAENKPLMKWFKTEILSPVTGVVESVSPVTGQVLLREPPRVLELLGYVDGRVVEVIPQQGVVVETDCSLVQGIFGIGGETRGEIVMAVTSPDEELSPRHFTAAMKGKVVVGGSFISSDALARAKEVAVAGVVVGGIHDKDLRALLGYDLGVAITGTEQVGFTLILTEGFGSIPMAGKTFALLSVHAGQQASISGATQIRAGVIRPEIIIPKGAGAPVASGAAAVPEREGIRIGDQVRIIRDPLFGKLGEVASLPSDLQKIPTESDVRVMGVRFADGSTAMIPRANIELIEGI
jgi:biotin carboxyl carrier protein